MTEEKKLSKIADMDLNDENEVKKALQILQIN